MWRHLWSDSETEAALQAQALAKARLLKDKAATEAAGERGFGRIRLPPRPRVRRGSCAVRSQGVRAESGSAGGVRECGLSQGVRAESGSAG